MSAATVAIPQKPPAEENWYAVVTRYRCEKKVYATLDNGGFTAFLPLLAQVHRWSDRNKRIFVPLFPGYVFVHLRLSLATRLAVLRMPGVLHFVGFGSETVSIPTLQIDHLKMLLSHDVACSLHAFLNVGQRIRIRGGCLNGVEGVLEENGEKSLVISIDSIQRSIAIRIEGYELELI